MKTKTNLLMLLSLSGCYSDALPPLSPPDLPPTFAEEHVCLTSHESASIFHNNICNYRWSPESIPVLVRPFDGFLWSDFAFDAIDLSIQIINKNLEMEILTLDQQIAGRGVITVRELPEMNGSGLNGNTSIGISYDLERGVTNIDAVKIGVYQTYNHTMGFYITVLHELGHAIGIHHPKECTKEDDLNDVDCQCQVMNGCMLRFRVVDINALLEIYSHEEYHRFYLE